MSILGVVTFVSYITMSTCFSNFIFIARENSGAIYTHSYSQGFSLTKVVSYLS